MNYRKDVDGLRGLAVLLVVLFHAFPTYVPNGFLGVDIFFVISGFLITSIILSGIEGNNFSFVNFYVRRIKRIFPMAYLVLFVTALLGSVTLFDNEFNNLKMYLKSAAGFYLNFQVIRDTGYFDAKAAYKPLLHYWSLAIEEQFYLIWPLVLYVSFWIFSSCYRKIVAKRNKVLNLLLSFSFILLAAGLVYFLNQPVDRYFSSLVRAWELIAGCFTAVLLYRFSSGAPKRFLDSASSPLTLISLLFFFAGLFVDKTLGTVLHVFAASFYLIANESSKAKAPFKNAVVVWTGLISFSLYLWHWPILSFFRIYKPDLGFAEELGLVSLAFAVAGLTYKFIELPLKNQNWDLVKSGKLNFEQPRLLKVSSCITVALVVFSMSSWLPKVSDKVTNSLVFVEDSEFGFADSCLIDERLKQKYDLEWCFSDSFAKSRKGIVIGDSHAHALFPGLTSLDQNTTWQLVANHSCAPFSLKGTYENCRIIMDESLSRLKEKNDLQFVVFVMSNRVFDEVNNELMNRTSVAKIVSDLRAINSAGKTIVILKPVPEIAENIYACSYQRFSSLNFFDSDNICRISLSLWKERTKSYNHFLAALKQQVPNIVVVDPLAEICDENYCYAVRNGNSMYYDLDHLSFYGSRKVASKILYDIELSNSL